MKHRLLFFSIATLLFLSLINCAKRGIPSGGDPDTEPPKMVKSQPEEFTTNFDEKRIRIYFDEYIKVKDIRKQLIISPPIKEGGYIVYPQGGTSKYIDIQITDTLQENTTYSFNFGQSIVDNNEENPYEYFKYVFSTGSYIDSLEVGGVIKDALKNSPETFVSVMLYEIDSTYNDSTIYKETPTYITNTLDSVSDFKLSNLRAGKYKMVAMKDVANNYLFNPKTDKIGYIEEEVTIPTDSSYTITLFQEIPEFRATRPALVSKEMIVFGYEGEAKDMKIDLVSKVSDSFQYSITQDPEKDTLRYWFKHLPQKTDSLIFKVSKKNFEKEFTVKMKELKGDSLQIKPSHRGNLPLTENFSISANTPIVATDESLISIENKDSVAVAFTSKFIKEENRLEILFEKEESQRYKIKMLPKTITDFFGEVNDTLDYGLSTKAKKDYANIKLTLQNAKEYPLIIQIVNEKLEILVEKYVTEAQPSYNFPNIEPQNVYIRAILDTNKNGKWDTGNYLKNIQPERVVYNPKKIELRANWDWDETLIFK
ncbi:Ig-like domain-containing protein [Kordia jejudonensis]|uniref:Ig-like domain-containing protein n=1 Tax=Kordia jejudonensis TaxID=1348245 RepID=UPI000629040D|nr:Ig-like domain-containing protein [Kordia jejudonensis]